jgi:epoxyqueuosine reductase
MKPDRAEHTVAAPDAAALAAQIRAWGAELGFAQVGIADLDLAGATERLQAWLAAGCQGDMDYMERHAALRADPTRLLPGACRAITVRMDYLPREASPEWAARELRRLEEPDAAVVSLYARGRDYHKVLRSRLAELATRLEAEIGAFGNRAFVDSGPVMEKPLARNAGLGWIGKHTNLINERAGSLFMLGELYTDLPLPVDERAKDRCGSCSACLPACPTGAITAPYQLDARRCISYLTIEHHGSIPEGLRAAIGNRIFGCDDCQLVCPWNKFARVAAEPDFRVRHRLDEPDLVELFAWNEAEYLEKTEGSALRRLGFRRWLRNIAVALGNAPTSARVLAALRSREGAADPVVREHVGWALARKGISREPG